jgi:hypothetical protein
MKSHSKNEGYESIIRMFIKLDIDITDWVHEPTDTERGGMNFMLPNAEGELYLSWGDLYHIDMIFVNSKEEFKSTLMLPDTEYLVNRLEKQRSNFVGEFRDTLMKMFGEEE